MSIGEELQMLSPRKQRLFAVACCHMILPLLKDLKSRRVVQVGERSRITVEVAERFADGEASLEELKAARKEAGKTESISRLDVGWDTRRAAWFPAEKATGAAAVEAARAASGAIETEAEEAAREAVTGSLWAAIWAAASRKAAGGAIATAKEAAEKRQAILLQTCFLPTALIERHEGSLKLARSIYEARAFQNLPILADLLEEEGCQDEGVLKHCRVDKEHYRGCFVLDAILGLR